MSGLPKARQREKGDVAPGKHPLRSCFHANHYGDI
jgi:hypothetical protein